MKILGIDPGLRQTGWAVIEVSGQKCTQLAAGTVRSDAKMALADRLMQIDQNLEAVISNWQPDEASVEETFVNKDAAGALKLAQARAIALLVCAKAGLEVAEYAPNQIKKTVVGAGHADKSQVDYMVRLQVKNFETDSEDATDAVAIALCHAFLRKARQVA